MSTLRDVIKRYNIKSHKEERLPLVRIFRASSSLVGPSASCVLVIGVLRVQKLLLKLKLDNIAHELGGLRTAEPPAVYREGDTPEVSSIRRTLHVSLIQPHIAHCFRTLLLTHTSCLVFPCHV